MADGIDGGPLDITPSPDLPGGIPSTGATFADPDLLNAYTAGSTGVFSDPTNVAIQPGEVTDPGGLQPFPAGGIETPSGGFWDPASSDGASTQVSGSMIDWSKIAASVGTAIQNIAVKAIGTTSDVVTGRISSLGSAPPSRPVILGPTVRLPLIGNVSIIAMTLIAVVGFFTLRFLVRRR